MCTSNASPAGATSIPPALASLNAPNYNVSIHWAPDAFARLSGTSQTTTNDLLSITVYDPNLPNGSETVNYLVQNGTTMSAAAGLAVAINADANLQSIGEYASSQGSTVMMRRISGDTYSSSVTPGGSETIALAQDPTYSYLEDATIGSTLASAPFYTFYAFVSPTDFWNLTNPLLNFDLSTNQSFSSEQRPAAGDVGFTPRTPTTNPYNWSALFAQSDSGIFNPSMANTTIHEAGHELDFLYGQSVLPQAQGLTTTLASNSNLFQNELNADFNWLNQSSPCTYYVGWQRTSATSRGVQLHHGRCWKSDLQHR
jgi:hypothetical protein